MGADTSKNRNEACKQLLDYGFANYALISPELTEAADVPVKLGKAKSVSPRMGQEAQLLVEKGKKNSVITEVTLEESLTAPVNQGQRLGTMVIRAGEQVLSEVPLVAEESIERLTAWDLFVMVLRRFAMAAG